MITKESLDNLKNKLGDIPKLALQYKLDDITLGKHLYFDNREKLYFVLSRKEEIVSLKECAEIHMALCTLLNIERCKEQDSVSVEIKQFFNPGYFEETYSDEFSLTKNNPEKEALTVFVRDTLGLNEKENTFSLLSQEKKRSSDELVPTPSSLHADLDAELPVKESRASVNSAKTGNLAASETMRKRGSSTLLTYSSNMLFKTQKRHGNNIDQNSTLSPHLQSLLQELEEEFLTHPESRAEVVGKFSEIQEKASKFFMGITE